MARRGYSNLYEAPVIEYIPGFNENIAQAQLAQLADVNKKWDATEQAVANAIAEYGALPVRSQETPFVKQKISEFNKYVEDTVNKYGGRYDLAAGDITRKLAQNADFFSKAKQAYEQQKQYEPLYAKYAQNLLFKGEDPRTKPIFDEEGNFVGMPDFTPYERPDYVGIAYDKIGKALDNMAQDGKLTKSEVPWLMQRITTSGLYSPGITDEVRNRVKSIIPEIVRETPISFDPQMQEYVQSPETLEDYLVRGTMSRMSGKKAIQDIDNWGYKFGMENAEYNRRKGLENSPERLNVWGSPANEEEEQTYLKGKSYTQALDKPYWWTGNYNLSDKSIKDLKDKIDYEEKYIKSQDKKGVLSGIEKNLKVEAAKKLKKYKEEYNKITELKKDLDTNKELFKSIVGKEPTNYMELAQWMDQNLDRISKRTTQTRPVLHPITSDKLKTAVSSMKIANFRIGGENLAATDLNTVADELDTNPGDLKNLLADPDIVPRYNRTTGEYYINVPKKFSISSSTGKVDDSGSKGYTRLYFSPDQTTAEASIGLKTLKQAIAEDKEIDIPVGGLIYRYNPTYKFDKSDLNSKNITIFAPNNQGGRGERLIDEKGQPMVTSIRGLETHIEAINEANLEETYTKPYLKSK